MRMKLPILLLIQLDRLVTLIIVKTEQFHFFKIALNWLKIIQTLQVASRVIHKKNGVLFIVNPTVCPSSLFFTFFLSHVHTAYHYIAPPPMYGSLHNSTPTLCST